MTIQEINGPQKYIIGVTLPAYQNKKGIFINFIRINFGFPFIQKMIKDLDCNEELYSDNISISSKNDSLNLPTKRLKVDHAENRRTVYTGKECLTNSG